MKPGHRFDQEDIDPLHPKVGENPVFFLDRPDAGIFARPRIDGIDRIRVCQEWLHVEHKLERGPRDGVITLLEDRLRYLHEHGERPRNLRDAENPPERYRMVDPEDIPVLESVATWSDHDDGERPLSTRQKLNQKRGGVVATDGGEET